MAPLGPLARLFIQIIVPAVSAIAKAIPAAYGEALKNARSSGEAANAAKSVTKILRKQISRQEALQILSLNETTATPDAVLKVSEYFDRGGSLLLMGVGRCCLGCLYIRTFVSVGGSFFR
jgi:hypothetical protein